MPCKGFAICCSFPERIEETRTVRKPKQSLSGVLEKYAAQVGSAFRGAVTHSGPRK